MREHRESERELRPIEGTGRFPDHHGIEATVSGRDISEESRGLRPALPRERTALAHIEVISNDNSPVRSDQIDCPSLCQLRLASGS